MFILSLALFYAIHIKYVQMSTEVCKWHNDLNVYQSWCLSVLTEFLFLHIYPMDVAHLASNSWKTDITIFISILAIFVFFFPPADDQANVIHEFDFFFKFDL